MVTWYRHSTKILWGGLTHTINPMIVAASLAVNLFGSDISSGQEVGSYEQGNRLWENGYHQIALDHWELAFDSLNHNGKSDPRIGFRYIECVVGIRDTSRYGKASEMYYWALRAELEDRFIEAVEGEMKRIQPLLDQETKRYWRQLFDERDRQLLREMQFFWDKNNLLPSTSLNERLIEHWGRIHFAREHFTENRSSVYDSDERADIYVRLGPPDHIQTGHITFNSGAVRNRLYDLQEHDILRGSQIHTLQLNISRNFSPRRYEYWRYDQISANGPVFYLFGRPGGGGRYQLLDSLEDFISSSGYRSVITGQRGHSSALRAGYFLQFMLYHEMSTVDHYFGSRLMEYEQYWYRALSQNRIDGTWLGDMLAPDRAAADMREIQNRAPESISSFERDIGRYPIRYRDYRFLDDEKGPVTWLMLHSFPKEAIVSQIVMRGYHDALPGYQLKKGLAVYKEGEKVYQQITELHPGSLDLDAIYEPFYAGEMLADLDEFTRIQIFSELYTMPDLSMGDKHLAGLGSGWADISQPLKDNGSLLISDLVLGNSMQKPVSVRSAEMGVIAGNEMERTGKLQVYFEIYNLKPDEQDGSYRYRITYQLKPENRGWFRRSARVVSMTWESAPGRSVDRQFFEVDLSHTGSGNHTLTIIAEDLNSGDKFSRETDITLR